MSSGQYGGKPESADETREKQQQLLRSLSFRDFLDPDKPWVMVPEGSLLGYFDWVSERIIVMQNLAKRQASCGSLFTCAVACF